MRGVSRDTMRAGAARDACRARMRRGSRIRKRARGATRATGPQSAKVRRASAHRKRFAVDALEQASMENPVNLHGRADDLECVLVVQVVNRHEPERSRFDPRGLWEETLGKLRRSDD